MMEPMDIELVGGEEMVTYVGSKIDGGASLVVLPTGTEVVALAVVILDEPL